MHPPLHESAVQALPSSQPPLPPLQLPEKQASFTVHGLPSSHGLSFGSCWQVLAAEQPTVMHGLPDAGQSLALRHSTHKWLAGLQIPLGHGWLAEQPVQPVSASCPH